MEKEIWKEIPNFEDYEISNMGRCRKYTSRGLYKYLNGGKNEKSGKNYPTIHLYNRWENRIIAISQLVSEAFLPNPNNGWRVSHKNGDTSDNRVENLEWRVHKNRKY